ncbi:hypothetical protein L2E82_04169 [Cichorium intybus]|uniref:Uncharacterized protein n=1 Tax=Cichorium intybus TaxID=13427 RepID=A0ACB9H512_CICIN|nr:hypothetical protein L2E82_04169 [Cichorium intybus]
MITLFSLWMLLNTLVMGIPLLKAMYGDFFSSLMVQLWFLQGINLVSSCCSSTEAHRSKEGIPRPPHKLSSLYVVLRRSSTASSRSVISRYNKSQNVTRIT